MAPQTKFKTDEKAGKGLWATDPNYKVVMGRLVNLYDTRENAKKQPPSKYTFNAFMCSPARILERYEEEWKDEDYSEGPLKKGLGRMKDKVLLDFRDILQYKVDQIKGLRGMVKDHRRRMSEATGRSLAGGVCPRPWALARVRG